MAAPAGSPAAGARRSASGAAAPVLGLDVGGTKLAAGVVAGGEARSFLVAPTRAERGPEQGLERLFELGRRALADAGVEPSALDAVGIASGGPLDPTAGVLVSPPHLPGWRDVPIVALAAEAFGRPALLDNDATAAAAGEHRYGAGAGTEHMVYLTISTGVGGGVIANGRLYRGTTGNAAELGHVTVDWDGRHCRGCGRRGCLEAYVSGTSIAERARERGLAHETSADVAAAARAGDPDAAVVWDETVAALACGLVSIVNALEPQLVVLGGGVTRVGEQLFAPLRERVAAEAMGAAAAVGIVPAALGDRVGVVGAAAIVHERRGDGGVGA